MDNIIDILEALDIVIENDEVDYMEQDQEPIDGVDIEQWYLEV